MRSHASVMWAPMPAAVPLTAAMTGFSQSMIDVTRRWAPHLIVRPTSPTAFRRAVGPRRLHDARHAQIGAGAEGFAGRGQHHDANA